MKRLAKVAMMAALVGLVGCEQQAKSLENVKQFEKEIAEKHQEMERDNIGKQWAVWEGKDDMHDTPNVQLHIKAVRFNGQLDDFPALKAKEKNKPVLVIECKANTTKMFVAWHNMIADAGDTTQVTYRIGEHKAVKAEWQRATNYKALGLWNGKKAIPMIKKMLNEKQFIIETLPEAGYIEKATFNIEGLEKHINKVKNACHWN
ncbi:hypothetical protein ACR15_002134 [Escherichia coli]|nr:hypothetical protein [Escherichia coli]